MPLFRRSTAKEKPGSSVPPGVVVYAIGDIHGRADLLQQMLQLISEDAAHLDHGDIPHVVLLGDYIDRGPASAAVVDQILALARNPRLKVRALKGNHEEALLAFLADSRAGPMWGAYGGLETLRNYIGRPPALNAEPAIWEAAREALIEAIPPEHLGFYENLELYFLCGDYCFVHAGLRPGVPIDQQKEQDLLTIRAEFLSAKGPFEKVIVHGHTPNLQPVVGRQRIGIDTGAFATGVLTCLKLRGASSEFIQARAQDAPRLSADLALH
jgi:serine/threonine protein phosphatase 1